MSACHMQDRVAIVTGAGKGLGRAYAVELARQGAAVVVNNRRHAGETDEQTSAADTVRKIIAGGGRAIADHSDVEHHESGRMMVGLALDTFGRIDAVVANAAAPQASSFAKTSPDDFRRIFDVSFIGTLNLIEAAWPHMLDQGYGRIVTTTSSAGRYGQYGLSAYSAAKGAIEALTRTLAAEGARHGIRVNAVSPYAASQMTREHLRDDIAARFTPERVATLVAWLCNERCPANGEVLVSGGGRLRRTYPVETSSIGFDAATFPDAYTALLGMSGSPFPNSNTAFDTLVMETGLPAPQGRNAKGRAPVPGVDPIRN